MTFLFVMGLMFFGFLFSLVAIPLILLKVVLGVTFAVLTIPLRIVGGLAAGLARGLFKGLFFLLLLMIPLAIIALPFTILAFGAWLLYRLVRPRTPRVQVVA